MTKVNCQRKNVKLLVPIEWLEKHKHPSETDAGFFYRMYREWETQSTVDELVTLITDRLNNIDLSSVQTIHSSNLSTVLKNPVVEIKDNFDF